MILPSTNILETNISGEQKPHGVLLIKWGLESPFCSPDPEFFPGTQGYSHNENKGSFSCSFFHIPSICWAEPLGPFLYCTLTSHILEALRALS